MPSFFWEKLHGNNQTKAEIELRKERGQEKKNDWHKYIS